MSLAEKLLPEFDEEMANTRKILALVPDDKLNWQAHPKSNSIGWLAHHLADIPSWVLPTLNLDQFDAGLEDPPQVILSRAEYLELFDRNVAEAREALLRADDAEFAKPWKFLWKEQEVFTLPKEAVIRTWVMNHIIHHRAHMCVYYRLNDIPVPGMYGPSADDAGM